MASINVCGRTVLVDDADIAVVSAGRWHINNGYARGNVSVGKRYMHQVILGTVSGEEVDHANGNTLDNRRANLRKASRSGQAKNRAANQGGHSSKFKGVFFVKTKRPWRVTIGVDGKLLVLGTYADEVDAAKVYDAAARFYHGEFARTNFEGTEALSRDQIMDRCRALKGFSSRFRGVRLHVDGRWDAYVFRNGQHVHLGLFEVEEQAARARDRAVGPKAKLNFPMEAR